ncbi:MAG: phosphoribosylglycinamide formyltransferase [Rhodanobacteraceae bacterium]
MTQRLRIAVLVSGRGSNLEALIGAERAGTLPIEIVLVASDKPQAAALERARASGIATFALDRTGFASRREFDRTLFDKVAEYTPGLIVLAGFMRVLGDTVVTRWRGRMINIHPSLLPAYRGLDTHRRAIAAAETMHGASVHFVTTELDGGPVIAQVSIALLPNETPDTLAARLLPDEHRLLKATVGLLADGRVALADDGVHLDGIRLVRPLLLQADGTLAMPA